MSKAGLKFRKGREDREDCVWRVNHRDHSALCMSWMDSLIQPDDTNFVCKLVQLSNLMQFLDAASSLVVLDREQCLGDTQIGSPCRAIGRVCSSLSNKYGNSCHSERVATWSRHDIQTTSTTIVRTGRTAVRGIRLLTLQPQDLHARICNIPLSALSETKTAWAASPFQLFWSSHECCER